MMLPSQFEALATERMRAWEKEVQTRQLLVHAPKNAWRWWEWFMRGKEAHTEQFPLPEELSPHLHR